MIREYLIHNHCDFALTKLHVYTSAFITVYKSLYVPLLQCIRVYTNPVYGMVTVQMLIQNVPSSTPHIGAQWTASHVNVAIVLQKPMEYVYQVCITITYMEV